MKERGLLEEPGWRDVCPLGIFVKERPGVVIMRLWWHGPLERTDWALLLLLSILFCPCYKTEIQANMTPPSASRP